MVRPNAGTKGVPRSEREAQILDEASREFGEVGYAGTSLQTIAQRAGISKPLVYQYFGSKEGLFVACLDRAGARLGGEIERIADGEAVGIERGILTLAGMFTVLEPERHLWRLLHDRTAPASGPVAETIAAHTDRIGKLAHEGVTELLALAGDRDPLDVSAMTATWLGIVDSLMSWWVDHPDETADSMLSRCVRLVEALFSDATRGHLSTGDLA
jgi:AcrR family transcriptional regulator